MGFPTLATTALLLVLACQGVAWGQAAERPTVVTEAERLRSAGDFSAAVKLLEAHHAAHPEDPDVARLLAQTLYWMGERARARAVYASALERHPGAPALRFEFARMLAETGNRREARALLAPLVGDANWRGEAAALLGTLAYWDGDLPLAVRLFRDALAADPAHREARRQLEEIRQASTPWVKVGAGYWHDDQPLDRLMAAIEAGWFPTPLTPVVARVDGRRYSADEPLAAPMAEVEVSHVVPAARLQLEAIGGIVHRSSDGGADRVGSLAAGLRLPRGLTPGVRVQRSAYFHTTASLATPVTFTALSTAVTWNHAGWMAEAEHQRRRYFDQNEGWASFAWILAPVVRTSRSQYHLGYAVSASDTREARFSADGRYEPYHTPLDQRVHSALAAARWVGPRGHAVDLNASAGLRATETAPVLTGIPDMPLAFAERRFRPGTVRAGIVVPLSGSLLLNAHAEAGRGSYYTWRAVSLNLTYRFLSMPATDARGRALLRGGARTKPARDPAFGSGIPELMRWPLRHGG